jgi:hypothetical protein
MGEAKVGEAFITHEYDEAIAVQQSIVDAEKALATSHPVGSSRAVIKTTMTDDVSFLSQLKALGKPRGATGKVEDVASGLKDLMDETLSSAKKEGTESEYYEAHAVLLTMKRKQMDSAGGMLRIARATRDSKLRTAAAAFAKSQKDSCKALADELAVFAARIATTTSPKASVSKSKASTTKRSATTA